MIEQDPLWTWTAAWPVGTKVRSLHTNNDGTVTAVDPLGRHILIAWNATFYRDAEPCRHHSDRGLERA